MMETVDTKTAEMKGLAAICQCFHTFVLKCILTKNGMMV